MWDKIEIVRENGDIVIRRTHKEKGSWFETVLWTTNTMVYSMTAQGVWDEVWQYLYDNQLDEYIVFTVPEISGSLGIE